MVFYNSFLFLIFAKILIMVIYVLHNSKELINLPYAGRGEKCLAKTK
jgi:hypothetical protein